MIATQSVEAENMNVTQAYDRWVNLFDDNESFARDLNMRCLRLDEFPLAGARVFEAGCGIGLRLVVITLVLKHVQQLGRPGEAFSK